MTSRSSLIRFHTMLRNPRSLYLEMAHPRLGVLTDTGCSTPHIEATLTRCHALVLECNHDAHMLANGNYPTVSNNA